MMLHIDMSDFYIGVHSDASIKSFTSNRSGNFKTLLTKEIDLENVEYKVAISSITRYYETSMEDVVVVYVTNDRRLCRSRKKQSTSLMHIPNRPRLIPLDNYTFNF